MLVTWMGGGKMENEIILEQVIFIADSLLGHGTTVWGSLMCVTWPTWERVIIKDSWIDLMRKYTEGSILVKLNDAKVEGVPQFIHEQQVETPHPSCPGMINYSTYTLHALMHCKTDRHYHLHVLCHLITQPVCTSVMEFSLLALLVLFIDYVLSTSYFFLPIVHLAHEHHSSQGCYQQSEHSSLRH